MTTLREAAAQALDALTKIHPGNMSWETGDAWLDAVQILREALAQPEQEPVADTESDVLTATYMLGVHAGKKATNRKPLTDEEIIKIWNDMGNDPIAPSVFSFIACVRKTEQAHGIGEKK